MNKMLAYFLGVIHDAHIICRKSVSQYGFEIEQKNERFAKFLQNLFAQIFGIKPRLELRKRNWGKYWRLRIYSKEIYEEIIGYDFKKLLIEGSRPIKRELIRGFYDAEGSASIGEVRMFSTDTELLRLIRSVLIKSFGLRVGNIVVTCNNVYQVPIYANRDKLKFMSIFQPNHPDKIIKM